MKKERIVIVANRLPVTIRRSEHGLEAVRSVGGLATGLSSLSGKFDTLWVGWPGAVTRDDRKAVEEKCRTEFGCHPIFFSNQLLERYYEGFSNRCIWPVFHSISTYARYSAQDWEGYKKANTLFCEKIISLYQPGDIIWIHDYHLMLLPRLLREKIPDVRLGFFLHIPFPHYDIFRLVPQHRQILDSLLALDLIGFHTYDYAQAFLGSVRRLCGHDNTLGQIMAGEHLLQVDVFPMGIDFQKYEQAPRGKAMQETAEVIRESLAGAEKAVFSVSRLDYTKGIPKSLEAIRTFFELYPEWKERVVFVLVVVPSREKVERYAALKREIDELVGCINSAYGTLKWLPVRYIYRSLSFEELLALYANSDVALVAPLRDGMNLIAKEYLAARNDDTGVLILSEMAGAAKELMESVIVNPNSRQEIAHALNRGLTMAPEEQQERNRVMRQRLRENDIYFWVRKFFDRLDEVKVARDILTVRLLDPPHRAQLIAAGASAPARLILLDYDGTLVPFADKPGAARPDAALLALLEKLTALLHTHVVIVSGRDRHTLNEWLSRLDLTIVAEHGGWERPRGERQWQPTMTLGTDEWKKDIRPLLNLFVGRIPGSFIEEKDFSLVWHYRIADRESAVAAARELLDTLSNFAINLHIQVLPGNKTVEVRTMGISKGYYFSRRLAETAPAFILAMGDDWTDEDLFAVLPASAYSIKVGSGVSKARFNLKSVRDVLALLEELGG